MRKKSLLIAATAIISSAAVAATMVPYTGTVSSSTLMSGGGDQHTSVRAVFGCKDDTFGPVDLCIDSDSIIYNPTVGMTMHAQISPRLSVHARNIVMRYTFGASAAEGGPDTHTVALKRPDNGFWNVAVTRDHVMMVTCASHDGGDTWPDCRKLTL